MRVLVALDTSEIGESAAVAVAAWSRSAELDVHLLSVVHPDEVHATTVNSISGEFIEPEDTEPGHIPALGGSQYGEGVAKTGDRMPMMVETRGQALASARSSREAYLQGVAARHFPSGKVTAHVEFSENTPESIVETAATLGVDVIAMATHGRSGIRHALMGSVAERVMRQSAVPVVIIGPRAHQGA
jgi:nucleotide-binding universal stress UspA family protein